MSRRSTPTDVRAIGAWLTHYWGVAYSPSGLTQLLHRLGFSYKLTTPVPCEADPVRQATFLAEQLQPLLEQAAAGQAVVYFADAAHPTHNTRSTRVWTRTGQPRPLPTVSGRERVNLNAAVNAHCPTQVHVDPTNCVNAQSTMVLYEKILAAHPGEQPAASRPSYSTAIASRDWPKPSSKSATTSPTTRPNDDTPPSAITRPTTLKPIFKQRPNSVQLS